VIHVLQEENNLLQNVHAHQVKLILMDIANHVTTDVLNVMNLLLIVTHVLLTEFLNQTVGAQMEPMMMVTMLSVHHV
jgi:hypothetical protein